MRSNIRRPDDHLPHAAVAMAGGGMLAALSDQQLVEWLAVLPPGCADALGQIVAFSIPTASLAVFYLLHQYGASECRDRLVRNRILILCASVLLSVALAHLSKAALCRAGPQAFLASGASGFHPWCGSVDASSLPSVYCAGAGAIAATYWIVLPDYRLTNLLLCGLALAGQVATGAAFASDCFAGLALGLAVFYGLKRLFDACGAPLAEKAPISFNSEKL